MKQLFPETKLSAVKDKNGNYLGDLLEADSDSLLIPKAKVQELSRKDNNGTNEWFNGNGQLNTEATPEDVQAAIDGAVSISGVFISESNTFQTNNEIVDGVVTLDAPKLVTTDSLINLKVGNNTTIDNEVTSDSNNPVSSKGISTALSELSSEINTQLESKANKSELFSGDYNDLTNKPELFDGDYDSLTNKPELFDGSYDSLTDTPELFDGDYYSLTNTPDLFDGDYDSLTNKPQLFSGSYNDLTNKPNTIERFEINNGDSTPAGIKNGDIVIVNFSNRTLLGTVTESDIKEFDSYQPGSNTVFYPKFDTYQINLHNILSDTQTYRYVVIESPLELSNGIYFDGADVDCYGYHCTSVHHDSSTGMYQLVIDLNILSSADSEIGLYNEIYACPDFVYEEYEDLEAALQGKDFVYKVYSVSVESKVHHYDNGNLIALGESAQPDWSQSDSTAPDFIKNKPTLFSGDYNDLSNKPTIPSLSGYATETWVGNQGYLTQHQDISGKADKSAVGNNSNLNTTATTTLVAAINEVNTNLGLVRVALYNIIHGTSYTSVSEVEQAEQNNG